jgi:hypothetical protein
MKAQLLASILAESLRKILKRHECACPTCQQARANLAMADTECQPRPVAAAIIRFERLYR